MLIASFFMRGKKWKYPSFHQLINGKPKCNGTLLAVKEQDRDKCYNVYLTNFMLSERS